MRYDQEQNVEALDRASDLLAEASDLLNEVLELTHKVTMPITGELAIISSMKDRLDNLSMKWSKDLPEDEDELSANELVRPDGQYGVGA